MDDVSISILRYDFFRSMIIDFVLPNGEEIRATLEHEIINAECKFY